ncbi:MAG: hypothetical protein EXR88_02365 [Gammaproteobacteria bacterium]|nr:hypothetical protein [Gammaproteobacteria bacterium]
MQISQNLWVLLWVALLTTPHLALSAEPILPEPITAPAPPAAALPLSGAQFEGAKSVCRSVKMTGSRVRRTQVCTTSNQERAAKDWLRQQQNNSATESSNAAVNGGGG